MAEVETNPTVPTMPETEDFEYLDWLKYKEMFRRMDRIDSFIIASQISELGIPRFNNKIPTAQVSIDIRNPDTVMFDFSKSFYRSLSIEDLSFVFVHENLHVVMMHCQRFMKFNWKMPHDLPKLRLAGLAADCIVNVWCDALGFPPSPELREKCVYAEKLGYPNFSPSTTMEDIYHFLLKKNEEELKEFEKFMDQIDSHEGLMSMDGPGGDEFAEKTAGSMKDEFLKSGQDSMDKKHIQAMKDKNEERKNNGEKSGNPFIDNAKKTWGRGSSPELRHYQLLRDRVSNDILRQIHRHIKSERDFRPKETWNRAPRKLMHVYPGIILPALVECDDPKYRADLWLDCSGSITEAQIAQGVRFARSFPLDQIEYQPLAFGTNYFVLNKAEFYNRNAYPKIPDGGGTDISNPERYIQEVTLKKGGKRPDLVLIITDGCGEFPVAIHPKHQSSYVWILTANGDESRIKQYCPGGYIFKTNIQ